MQDRDQGLMNCAGRGRNSCRKGEHSRALKGADSRRRCGRACQVERGKGYGGVGMSGVLRDCLVEFKKQLLKVGAKEMHPKTSRVSDLKK